MKTWESDKDIAQPFLTSALDGREWSDSCPCCSTPREGAPSSYWIVGWLGLRAGLHTVEKRKILHCWKSNLGCPARSPSLYRLSYPNSTLPAVLSIIDTSICHEVIWLFDALLCELGVQGLAVSCIETVPTFWNTHHSWRMTIMNSWKVHCKSSYVSQISVPIDLLTVNWDNLQDLGNKCTKILGAMFVCTVMCIKSTVNMQITQVNTDSGIQDSDWKWTSHIVQLNIDWKYTQALKIVNIMSGVWNQIVGVLSWNILSWEWPVHCSLFIHSFYLAFMLAWS
jgi:hypothetical protein